MNPVETPAATHPQQQQVQQPIAIQAQYVKDLSFENPGAPGVLAGQSQAPQIGINLDLDGRQMGERQFEILLKINAEAKSEDTSVFIAELTYGGVVQVAEQVPAEQVTALAMIEGARQLFPFARAVLATATRDGGFPPLLMNPVNFVAFYQQMVARQQAAAAAEQPAGDGEVKLDLPPTVN
jgi:preprotein translocase subunit SecB